MRNIRKTILAAVAVVLLIGGLIVSATFSGAFAPRRASTVPLAQSPPVEAIPQSLILYEPAGRISLTMEHPKAVAVDTEGVVVAGEDGVHKFSFQGVARGVLATSSPATAVAVSDDGRTFVGVGDHIEVFDAEGKRVGTWPKLGERPAITSISIGADVFVGDYGQRVIWRLSKDGKSLGQIDGRSSHGDGGLRFCPCIASLDVAADAEGNVWMADHKNWRVLQYDPDGNMNLQWGERSGRLEDFCGACNPTRLAVGLDGRVYTSEKDQVRIKVYDPNGKFIGVVAGPESFSDGAVGLDLAVDKARRVVVLDPKARAVLMFSLQSHRR